MLTPPLNEQSLTVSLFSGRLAKFAGEQQSREHRRLGIGEPVNRRQPGKLRDRHRKGETLGNRPLLHR